MLSLRKDKNIQALAKIVWEQRHCHLPIKTPQLFDKIKKFILQPTKILNILRNVNRLCGDDIFPTKQEKWSRFPMEEVAISKFLRVLAVLNSIVLMAFPVFL